MGLAAMQVCSSPLMACDEVDVVVVLTEWDEFRQVLPADVANAVRGRQVVDARNLLDKAEWLRAGFEYQGIGR
jgi:UDPglucose 6-dehydrogenase